MFSQQKNCRGHYKSKDTGAWIALLGVALLVLLTASWSLAASSKMSTDLQNIPASTTENVVIQYYTAPTSTDVNTAMAAGASNGKALGLVKGYRWTIAQGNVQNLISKDSSIKYENERKKIRCGTPK